MTHIQSKRASTSTVARSDASSLSSSKDIRSAKDSEATAAVPSPVFDRPDLPTRSASTDKKARPRSQGANSALEDVGKGRQSASSADAQAPATASTPLQSQPRRYGQGKAAAKKKPMSSSGNSSRNTVLQTAVLWLMGTGLIAQPAKADLLTFSVQTGYRGISDYINASLNSTLDSSNSVERLHTVDVSTGFPFVRNLVGLGPGGTMVMSSPDAAGYRAEPLTKVQSFLKDKGVPFKEMPHNVNMADVHYDPELDLLIIAHTAEPGTRCESTSLTPSCSDKVASVMTAFGKPKNIIQLFKNPDVRGPDGFAKCYDLDIFFHLTTNPEGKKVALIYEPCIVSSPAMGGLTKEMSTKNMMKNFKRMGIEPIHLSPEDYGQLAGNAVSLEPGKLMFGTDVSDKLKAQLSGHGIEAIVPEKPFAVINQPGQDDYGIHCVSANIPGIGTTRAETRLIRQRRADPLYVEVTPTPVSKGPTLSFEDGPEGVKPEPQDHLGEAASIAVALAGGVAAYQGVKHLSSLSPAEKEALDAEMLGSSTIPGQERPLDSFRSLNTEPPVPPSRTPRVIDTGQQTALDAQLAPVVLSGREAAGPSFGSLNFGPSTRPNASLRPRVIDAGQTGPSTTAAPASQDSGTGNVG